MAHYGIPNKFITITQQLYLQSSCRVIHNGNLTDSFTVETGVRQGCLLSPFLFLLAVDWIMKTTTAEQNLGIQWTMWSQLEDLDFADDIVLLSTTQAQMQTKFTKLAKTAATTGLHINKSKTKVINIDHNTNNTINLDGEALEEVDTYTYLGSIVGRDGGSNKDIQARIGKARTAF